MVLDEYLVLDPLGFIEGQHEEVEVDGEAVHDGHFTLVPSTHYPEL